MTSISNLANREWGLPFQTLDGYVESVNMQIGLTESVIVNMMAACCWHMPESGNKSAVKQLFVWSFPSNVQMSAAHRADWPPNPHHCKHHIQILFVFAFILSHKTWLPSTAIEPVKYCIPSDLQSQVRYRSVSTKVGDHLGILGAVVFVFLPLVCKWKPTWWLGRSHDLLPQSNQKQERILGPLGGFAYYPVSPTRLNQALHLALMSNNTSTSFWLLGYYSRTCSTVCRSILKISHQTYSSCSNIHHKCMPLSQGQITGHFHWPATQPVTSTCWTQNKAHPDSCSRQPDWVSQNWKQAFRCSYRSIHSSLVLFCILFWSLHIG